jgi:hypothetical protein
MKYRALSTTTLRAMLSILATKGVLSTQRHAIETELRTRASTPDEGE